MMSVLTREPLALFPSPLAGEGGEAEAIAEPSQVRGLLRKSQTKRPPHPPSLCSGTLSRKGRG